MKTPNDLTNDSPKRSYKPKWDRAILALMQGATREKAAEAAGVNPATLYRWQKDPEFQKAYWEARHDVFGQAMGRLQYAANTAVDTLNETMKDPESRSRVQAAKCVLELCRKSLELDDLRMQVEELWRAEQERSQEHA